MHSTQIGLRTRWETRSNPCLFFRLKMYKYITMAEPIAYFVVNKDLNMTKGKIAAQVGHAAIEIFKRNPRTDIFTAWDGGSHAKVVLCATQAQMTFLADRYPEQTVRIYDEGRTQIDPDSFTVLAFYVMPKGANDDVRGLKLL
jgi:peptidyl-tRNA hydrolase, PTH2 family